MSDLPPPSTTVNPGVEDFGPGLVADLAYADGFVEVNAVSDMRRASHRAYYTYEAIKQSGVGRFLATPDGEIYVYDDGIWQGTPDGEQRLRELASQALLSHLSNQTFEELKGQVQAQDTVPRDTLGAPAGTIPLANGLYDIETGELREYEPEHYVINALPVGYNPQAETVEWGEFVEEVVEDGMADAVQEYVGYCLMVNQWRFDRVLMLVGSGSNGKSTFLNVVTELLGRDNVTGFKLGDLVHDQYYVAQLFGKVANIDPDVTGKIGTGGHFKALTGGDKNVPARHPYGRPFSFAPKAKQLYAANQVPEVSDDTPAFFRRWLIVEFPNEYTDPDKPGPDKDADLEQRLICELPGILNWAIKGLERLLEQGHFTNEGDTEDKRERWLSWGDTVDKFISECVEIVEDEKHTAAEVHERYKAFCHDVLEEPPESQRTLTEELKKMEKIRYSSTFRFNGRQERGFKHLGFTTDAPTAEPADRPDHQSALPQDGD